MTKYHCWLKWILKQPDILIFKSKTTCVFGGLLWCARVLAQLFSHVWLFVTPRTVAHQAPLSMGILQARILEWVAMPSSRGSSQPRDWTHVSQVSCIGRQVLYHWTTWEALIVMWWDAVRREKHIYICTHTHTHAALELNLAAEFIFFLRHPFLSQIFSSTIRIYLFGCAGS